MLFHFNFIVLTSEQLLVVILRVKKRVALNVNDSRYLGHGDQFTKGGLVLCNFINESKNPTNPFHSLNLTIYHFVYFSHLPSLGQFV